jgi:hypothetical protein
MNHLRHAFHDVVPAKDPRPVAHEIGHAAAVTRSFKDLVGENGDALGVIKLQAALLTAPREIRRNDDQ